MTDQTSNPIRTSDKLALSATLSVLMMTVYVLFGGDAARPSLEAAGFDRPVLAAAPSLGPIRAALATAGTRRLLY